MAKDSGLLAYGLYRLGVSRFLLLGIMGMARPIIPEIFFLAALAVAASFIAMRPEPLAASVRWGRRR